MEKYIGSGRRLPCYKGVGRISAAERVLPRFSPAADRVFPSRLGRASPGDRESPTGEESPTDGA